MPTAFKIPTSENLKRKAARAAAQLADVLRIVAVLLGWCPLGAWSQIGDLKSDGPHARAEAAVVQWDKAIKANPASARAYHERGVAHFQLGQMEESVRDFDKVIELIPERKPEYWQRGISLYYAGRYEDGQKQFEVHKTVNPEDVENAAWHFLCVAKLKGVAEARKSLITIHGDARIPMMKILALFAGTATADDVLREAAAGNPSPAELRSQMFYAHLYLGLFDAANGDKSGELEHIRKAALEYSEDHYMGDVARVHWEMLQKSEKTTPKP